MSNTSSARTTTGAPRGRTLAFGLNVDPEQLHPSEITGVRVMLFVGGLLALALGVLVLVWPDTTLAIAAVLFGLYFLIAGIVRLARGIFVRGASAGSRILGILFGIILVIAGIVMIRNPLSSLVILALVIGVSWIIEGVAALVETAPDSSRWFGVIFGAVSIVAGIVILFSPVEALGILVLIGGIFLIVSGVMQLAQAFMFGRKARAARPEPVMRDTD